MNAISEKIFIRKTIIPQKLISYGFKDKDGRLEYSTLICDEQMRLTVYVGYDGSIDTEVYDMLTQEPYTLFLVEDAVGSFVGEVRTEYENLLSDIADKCCQTEIFKGEYTKRILNYVFNRYGDTEEYLWPKSPENAIWRRKDNRKWYGLIMAISRRKLGFDSDERVEVINLRANPDDAANLVDNNRYFVGYHMNKKRWITMCLDGSVEFEEICRLLDESYLLAK